MNIYAVSYFNFIAQQKYYIKGNFPAMLAKGVKSGETISYATTVKQAEISAEWMDSLFIYMMDGHICAQRALLGEKFVWVLA